MIDDEHPKLRRPKRLPGRVNAKSSRSPSAKLPDEEEATLGSVHKLLQQTQEQISLLYGVLEELCERQEMLAQWQSEFGKRMLDLQESQSWTLQDVAEGAFQAALSERQKRDQRKRLKETKREVREDVKEMDQLIDELDDSADDLAARSRKRRDAAEALALGRLAEINPMLDPEQREAQEPVLIMPSKTDLH